ncbi:N-acetylneuraminate synthase family protein [Poriferisphaera sp. WC338]|uniref:N-acetylneuraminate synthase family protein n=1 Tax=Poriferisphaera sp. WC338 TaxID=3425129 RepID=UPI003D819A19
MSTQAQRDSGLFLVADESQAARVCVIAEIGVNHDGQIDRAIDLVQAAADAGANAVKFQYFHPDRLLSNQAQLAAYQRDANETDVGEMLGRLVLSLDNLQQIASAVKAVGLKLIVTPFSEGDVSELGGLDIDAVKIASPDAVNPVLLGKAARLGVPLLISTGTCELDELEFAAELLRGQIAGGALMQCVSSYPTPIEEAGLGGMLAMWSRFGLPVGYSDHTQEIVTGALAVAAGAIVIEKHLTYDRNADGPDHAVSLEPNSFADYVQGIRVAEQVMGVRWKGVREVEREVRQLSRQSVCVRTDLLAGHIMRRDDLEVRRPGSGIPAMQFDAVIGKRLMKTKNAGDLLFVEDLA